MKALIENRSTAKELLQFGMITLIMLFLWHGRVLIGQQVFCGGDLVNHIIPMRMIQERQGWFSGWDPYSFSGRPLLDEVQTAAFYPLNWLHLLGASIERTMSLLGLLHLAISAFGFFVLTRARASFAASTLAAMIWTFGAFQLLKITAGIYVFTHAFAWLPWMLWAAERQSLHRGSGLIACGLLALFGGLQLTAGSPQPVQITWCGLAVYTLARLLRPAADEKRSSIIGGFFLAGSLTLLMSVPELVGVLRFQTESFPRAGQGPALLAFLSDGSLTPKTLLTFVLPELFGPGNSEELYWGSTVGFHETNVFLGIIPIVLAAFALLNAFTQSASREERIRTITLVVLMLGSLLVAFGANSFLFPLLVKFVPTFSFFRVPARWLVWFIVPLGLLAARGLDDLFRAGNAKTPRTVFLKWIATAGGAILILLAARLLVVPLLERSGLALALATVPPAIQQQHRALLLSYASGSITWELMIIIAGAAAAVFLIRGYRQKSMLLAIFILCAADLYRFWNPFTNVIPHGAAPQQVETETPYHLIAAEDFRSYFYADSPLMQSLKAGEESGRVHYDDLIPAYMNDQNQRELLNERPTYNGLSVTRGYQQLHLRNYVDDYYTSIVPSPDGKVGAFLNATQMTDSAFLDAYNVTRVVSYSYPELDATYARLGLTRGEPNEYGAIIWTNPHPRGWAWLSLESKFLVAGKSAALGTIDKLSHDANHWSGDVTISAPCYLHLSSPEYSAWRLTASSGTATAESTSGRTIFLPAPGSWHFERTYYNIGLKPTNILLSLLGIAFSAGLIVAGYRRRHGSLSIHAGEPEAVSL